MNLGCTPDFWDNPRGAPKIWGEFGVTPKKSQIPGVAPGVPQKFGSKCAGSRNNNGNKLETIRKEINTLLKILKMSIGERSEIVNKYKWLHMALSKMYDNKEQDNVLNENEEKSFVRFNDLIDLRNKNFLTGKKNMEIFH